MEIIALQVEDTLDLRHRVLRPDQPKDSCQCAEDFLSGSFHLGGRESGQLICVVSVYPKSEASIGANNSYQLKWFAVDPEFSGKGVGSTLLRYALNLLHDRSASLIWCYSRIAAVPFYLKNGFKPVGPVFEQPSKGKYQLLSKNLWLETRSVSDLDPSILYRDFRAEDCPNVFALWRLTGVGGEHRGDNVHVIESTLKHGGRLLVLEDINKSEIVGTCWLTYDGRRVYLHHLAVDPRWQGKGLGKWLTLRSLDFAHSLGAQIKLEVDSNNKVAHGLYEKTGFSLLENHNVLIRRNVSLQ